MICGKCQRKHENARCPYCGHKEGLLIHSRNGQICYTGAEMKRRRQRKFNLALANAGIAEAVRKVR